MQRSTIASAAIALLVGLPACSFIIDTNPDGVIDKKSVGGQSGNGGDDTGTSGSKAINRNAGGSPGVGGTVGAAGNQSGFGGAGGTATLAGTGATVNGTAGSSALVGGGSGSVQGGTGALGLGGALYQSGGASGTTTNPGGATATGGSGPTLGVGGTAGVAGLATGGLGNIAGRTGSGGATSTGGVAAGGVVATGGTTATGGVVATGGTTQLVCSGTTKNCDGACVDVNTDKANCGACGTVCEGYQFCADGKCLPTYQSTRLLPITNSDSSSTVDIVAAAVQTNKSAGDLMVQVKVTNAVLTMSGPADLLNSDISAAPGTAAGLARYTATGTLVWGRDLAKVLGSSVDQPINPASITPLALTSTGDVAFAYVQAGPPPTGPGLRQSLLQFAKVNSGNASLAWAITTEAATRMVVPRFARNDFLLFGDPPDNVHGDGGGLWQVVDNSTSGTSTRLGLNYSDGAAQGSDGSSVWLWGFGHGGSYILNPWSAQTYEIPGNPTMVGGYDAFIIGVRDDGTSTGTWMSEGDWGPTYKVALDADGDLVVAAESYGYTAFNGGQDLLPSAGKVLVKINHTSGQIVWRKPINDMPATILAVPGGRVVTMTQERDASNVLIPTAPYHIDVYSGVDGSLLSSISSGTMAQKLAAGKSDMFVLGVANAATDFNPGSGTDPQGTTPGVYISRFSF